MRIDRPAIRYYGAKFRLAPWIVSHFPAHRTYVEPFGGSAGVLLCKPVAPYEVYNDIDSAVVNFFRVLRERPDDLQRLISLTPYARAELDAAKASCDDPLEAARRFYVRSWQAYSGPARRENWRYVVGDFEDGRASAVRQWIRNTHLAAVAERLRAVQIESDDALAVVERYDSPGTLFYVDPPYLLQSRAETRPTYKHEYSDDDHLKLADTLRAVRGMVIISGIANPLYSELYAGWRRSDKTTRTNSAGRGSESLWLSPNIWTQLRLL